MAAVMIPERGFRSPGCDARCQVVRAFVAGVFGRSELLLHDPAAHEAFGRVLGAVVGASEGYVVRTGPLAVDLFRSSVAVDGRPVLLTATEWRLLVVLARRAGILVAYDEVTALVWGPTALEVKREIWQHTVRATVCRLRAKLRPADTLIRSELGLGLRLEVIPLDAPPPARVHPTTIRLAGRWSFDWTACRSCGRTDRPHNGRGWCTSCHRRELHAARQRGAL